MNSRGRARSVWSLPPNNPDHRRRNKKYPRTSIWEDNTHIYHSIFVIPAGYSDNRLPFLIIRFIYVWFKSCPAWVSEAAKVLYVNTRLLLSFGWYCRSFGDCCRSFGCPFLIFWRLLLILWLPFLIIWWLLLILWLLLPVFWRLLLILSPALVHYCLLELGVTTKLINRPT